MLFSIKRKKTIMVLGESVEVEVLAFSDREDDFMLMQDEVNRLAKKFEVSPPVMESEFSVRDLTFFPGGGYKTRIKLPEFRHTIRFCATYSVVRVIGFVHKPSELFKYYGSGSAGADTIFNWTFKPYAYEIAHKRAKVNAIRQALELYEYLVEGVDEQRDQKLVQAPDFMDTNNKDAEEKLTDMQLVGVMGLISRLIISDKDILDDMKMALSQILVRFDEYVNSKFDDGFRVFVEASDVPIGDDELTDHLNVFLHENMTKVQASEILKKFGDLTQ